MLFLILMNMESVLSSYQDTIQDFWPVIQYLLQLTLTFASSLSFNLICMDQMDSFRKNIFIQSCNLEAKKQRECHNCVL